MFKTLVRTAGLCYTSSRNGGIFLDYFISDRMSALKPSAIREIFKYTVDPQVISLAAGDPAPESLPVDAIQKMMAEVLSTSPLTALLYSQSEGYPPLRAKIQEMLVQHYHVGQPFDQVMVTTGAQQAMDLITKVVCNEGDTILCENPSFIGSLNTFRSYHTNLVGLPMKEDGIDLNALELALKTHKNVRLIYLIPNFQNPTGRCTSLEKRKAIYQLAKLYGVLIVEDNPYGDLRFEGEDIPNIKSFDHDGIVLYVGSFSKILSTGMRVGYLLAPEGLFGKLTVAKQCTDVHTSMPTQLLCYQFLKEFSLEDHLNRIQKIYKDKYHCMSQAIEEYFPASAVCTKPQGGLFVWCSLPEKIDTADFATKLVQTQKVAVVPGSAFDTVQGARSNCFRMNFSMPSPEKIQTGIEKIGSYLTEIL